MSIVERVVMLRKKRGRGVRCRRLWLEKQREVPSRMGGFAFGERRPRPHSSRPWAASKERVQADGEGMPGWKPLRAAVAVLRRVGIWRWQIGLLLMPIGPFAAILGLHLGRSRAVCAADISGFLGFGLHFVFFSGSWLAFAFEYDASNQCVFYVHALGWVLNECGWGVGQQPMHSR